MHRGGEGSPLVLLHGFTDTWRCWELILPALEAEHDVLAPTLAGHAGGPAIGADEDPEEAILAGVERAMDEAGFETANIAGNSLGGWVALKLAARGRAARSPPLAPAGGWLAGDPAFGETIDTSAPSSSCSRRRSRTPTRSSPPRRDGPRDADVRLDREHMSRRADPPPDAGRRRSPAVVRLIELARPATAGTSTPEKITCPVRLAWGTADQILVPPARRRPLPPGVDPAGRVGRARRRRPLPAARPPARDRAADPRLRPLRRLHFLAYMATNRRRAIRRGRWGRSAARPAAARAACSPRRRRLS